MKKRRQRYLLFVPVLLLPVYLFLFSYPSGKELCLRPVWAIDLSLKTRYKRVRTDNPFSWFRAGNRFGYFSLEGELHYSDEVLYDIALSDSGFINFAKVSDNKVFRDPNGNFIFGYKSHGYPLLDSEGKRLFSVNTDLSGIKRLTEEGEILWSNDFSSPITTLSFAEDDCVAGLLAGMLKIINPDGKVSFEYKPKGSRIPVILGTAISPDGKQVAVISGIDSQQLSILNKKEYVFSHSFTLELDSDFRREVMIQYSEDKRFLLFEDAAGLSVLELKRKNLAHIELPGQIQSISTAKNGIVSVSTRVKSNSYLFVFRPLKTILYAGSIKSKDVFLKQIENRIFIGIQNSLLRIDALED